MIRAQPQTRMRRSIARGTLLRAGVVGDYPMLREVDNDASTLFEQAGLELDLPDDHEFAVSERRRWQKSLADGTTIIAMDMRGRSIGFAAVSRLDGEPFLAQLSVRQSHMRRGIGSALLYAALDAAEGKGSAMWLTTYDHFPWNRAFYERNGFVCVQQQNCGADIRAELELERRTLPLPEKRVAMRRPLRANAPERPRLR